jgi:CRISPR-associated protein Cas1
MLSVETEAGKTEVAIGDVSELVLHGPVSLTTPAVAALLREEVPVTWASTGGWVMGHTVSTGHRNVSIRIAQYRAAFRRTPQARLRARLGRGKDQECASLPAPQFQIG